MAIYSVSLSMQLCSDYIWKVWYPLSRYLNDKCWKLLLWLFDYAILRSSFSLLDTCYCLYFLSRPLRSMRSPYINWLKWLFIQFIDMNTELFEGFFFFTVDIECLFVFFLSQKTLTYWFQPERNCPQNLTWLHYSLFFIMTEENSLVIFAFISKSIPYKHTDMTYLDASLIYMHIFSTVRLCFRNIFWLFALRYELWMSK